jgi:MFS transporter, putative metabolite:H+ symporter
MQAQTEQLTLGEVSDRLDRLPASRFHAKILIVAALSLLFDTLDTAVTEGNLLKLAYGTLP